MATKRKRSRGFAARRKRRGRDLGDTPGVHRYMGQKWAEDAAEQMRNAKTCSEAISALELAVRADEQDRSAGGMGHRFFVADGREKVRKLCGCRTR